MPWIAEALDQNLELKKVFLAAKRDSDGKRPRRDLTQGQAMNAAKSCLSNWKIVKLYQTSNMEPTRPRSLPLSANEAGVLKSMKLSRRR